jgi:excinuclease UvrABC ATPase subunit
LRSAANGYFSSIHLEEEETGRQTKSTATARFSRVLLDDKMIRLDEIDQHSQDKKDITLIIDRIVVKKKRTLQPQIRYKLPFMKEESVICRN